MSRKYYYVRSFSFMGEDKIYTGLFSDEVLWKRTPCIPATYRLLALVDKKEEGVVLINRDKKVLMFNIGMNKNLVCDGDIDALHYFEVVCVSEMDRDKGILDEVYEVYDAAFDRQKKDYEEIIGVLEGRIMELERDLEYYMNSWGI